jgi:DNA-directed RNA polymerase subunit RPC12/RpoP
MNGSTVRRYAMIAVGLLLTGWAVMISLQDDRPTSINDSTHCPECGRELPPQFQNSGECPYCLLGKGGKDRAGAGPPRRYLVPVLLIGLFLVLAATHLVLYLRSRWRLIDQDDELFCYFNCPQCHRKLRYRSRQSGHYGRCPTCRKPVLFPASA